MRERLALSIAGGVSWGRYTTKNGCWGWGCDSVVARVWDTALWGNVELGLEGIDQHGVMVRIFSGVTSLANGNAGRCEDGRSTCVPLEPRSLLYLGVDIGYAFDF